jgi:hypothetical protein
LTCSRYLTPTTHDTSSHSFLDNLSLRSVSFVVSSAAATPQLAIKA